MRKAAARNAVPRRLHGGNAGAPGAGFTPRSAPAGIPVVLQTRFQPGVCGRGVLSGRSRNSSSERPVTA